jgi:ParB/RepB/Spo0J family partition protein
MSKPKAEAHVKSHQVGHDSRVAQFRIQQILVESIRPEEGLERKRDREGHHALTKSIAKFGILTPITVRHAIDGSGDYLLIKGQGRTLACRYLGIESIPAIVVDDSFGESEKVQQFLVENVARLRMRPVDRALLIARARQLGEETVVVAKRFGVSPATVRRLESQLKGATSSEVAALRSGDVNLALHAVIVRHVRREERRDVIDVIGGCGLNSKELEVLFIATDWASLDDLGPRRAANKIALLRWMCSTFVVLPKGSPRERIISLATRLPLTLPGGQMKSAQQL